MAEATGMWGSGPWLAVGRHNHQHFYMTEVTIIAVLLVRADDKGSAELFAPFVCQFFFRQGRLRYKSTTCAL